MNWQNFHSYRVFEEFLQSIILERRSYITVGREPLDFTAAYDEIKSRFVVGFDDSEESFDDKAMRQFHGATANATRVFANLEYLWCMPVSSITGETKRSYALRWLPDRDVVSGDRYFFSGNHGIANPGMWHRTNKYHEILSICRIFKTVAEAAAVMATADARSRIEKLAYDGIYGEIDPSVDFYTENKCSSYHMLLHLAAPDRYEAIVSENHKTRIVSVFADVIAGEVIPDRERQIGRIREKLYDSHGVADDAERKRRWFFYLEDVKPLWIGKKTKGAQHAASAMSSIWDEEFAGELEGEKVEHTGHRLLRSGKLVLGAKVRDKFTCVACGFYYQDQIVQVHHLDPLSERKQPKKTGPNDLITLCPNCHFIAHFDLRKSDRFKRKADLIEGLQKILAEMQTGKI